MAEPEHPLVRPRVAVGVGLAGFCGAGWGMMATPFIGLGLALSLVGSLATIWLFWGELRPAFAKAVQERRLPVLQKELWIALVIISLTVVLPVYIYLASQGGSESAKWTATVVSFVASAGLGFLYGFVSRRHRSQASTVDAFASALYAGQIAVATSELAEKRNIYITVRCFNSTGYEIYLQRIIGAFSASETIQSRSYPIADLPPPFLDETVFQSQNIKNNSEFLVQIEQRLPAEIADKLTTVNRDYSVGLDCGGLNVMVGAHAEPKLSARIPLWDGIRLFRDPEHIQSNRIVIARMGTGEYVLTSSASAR